MTPAQIEKAVLTALSKARIKERVIEKQPIILKNPRLPKEKVKVRVIVSYADKSSDVDQWHANSPEEAGDQIETKTMQRVRATEKRWQSLSIYIDRI